jgi:hypothetical protein
MAHKPQQRHDRPGDHAWAMPSPPPGDTAGRGMGECSSGREHEGTRRRDVEHVREAIHRTYK